MKVIVECKNIVIAEWSKSGFTKLTGTTFPYLQQVVVTQLVESGISNREVPSSNLMLQVAFPFLMFRDFLSDPLLTSAGEKIKQVPMCREGNGGLEKVFDERPGRLYFLILPQGGSSVVESVQL